MSNNEQNQLIKFFIEGIFNYKLKNEKYIKLFYTHIRTSGNGKIKF